MTDEEAELMVGTELHGGVTVIAAVPHREVEYELARTPRMFVVRRLGQPGRYDTVGMLVSEDYVVGSLIERGDS